MSKLTSAVWWREVLDRAVRQGVQVLTPFLLLASAGKIDGVTALNTLVAAGLAAVVVVLKALSVFNTGSVYERAIGAAAGATVAVLPLDLFGVLHLDARSTITSILGTVALSLVGFYTNPPASTVAPVVVEPAMQADDVPVLGTDLVGE